MTERKTESCSIQTTWFNNCSLKEILTQKIQLFLKDPGSEKIIMGKSNLGVNHENPKVNKSFNRHS